MNAFFVFSRNTPIVAIVVLTRNKHPYPYPYPYPYPHPYPYLAGWGIRRVWLAVGYPATGDISVVVSCIERVARVWTLIGTNIFSWVNGTILTLGHFTSTTVPFSSIDFVT